MKQQASIEVDRPIADVFTFTNDQIEAWCNGVLVYETIDETPDGVGSTFRFVMEEHGRPMEFAGVVTKWEPPTLSAVRMVGDAFDIDAEYRFDDLDGRTRVTQASVVYPKGFMKVVFALFGWLMTKSSCDAAAKELQRLKLLMESPADEAATAG